MTTTNTQGAMPELDRTAPERIWLQVDTDGDPEDRSDMFPRNGEQTWCDHSIGGQEVEYVRADLAQAAPAQPAPGVESNTAGAALPGTYFAKSVDGKQHNTGKVCVKREPGHPGGWSYFATTASPEDAQAIADAMNARASHGQAPAGATVLCWVNEDELPEGLTQEAYSALFPHSKVDGVRMFPVFGPAAQAAQAAPAAGAVAGPSWEALHHAWRKVGADVAGLDWGAFTNAVHYAPAAAPTPATQADSGVVEDAARWCGNCGEWVTFFCRSKTVGECPMKLGRIVAQQKEGL